MKLVIIISILLSTSCALKEEVSITDKRDLIFKCEDGNQTACNTLSISNPDLYSIKIVKPYLYQGE